MFLLAVMVLSSGAKRRQEIKHLKHGIAICILNMDFQAAEHSAIVVLEIEVLDTQLGILWTKAGMSKGDLGPQVWVHTLI